MHTHNLINWVTRSYINDLNKQVDSKKGYSDYNSRPAASLSNMLT